MDENKYGFEPKQEFTMGGIAWTVIQTGTDWVKCITSECVEERAFDEGGKNNFAVSSLRVYLNGEFLRRLIQAGAPEEAFEYFNIDLTADDGLKDYGGDHVRIGLITCEEYRLLRGNIPALSNCWWWTATPDSPINLCARGVISDGTLNYYAVCNDDGGVRPICVLKSEILASYLGDKNCRVSAETVDQSANESGTAVFYYARRDVGRFRAQSKDHKNAKFERCNAESNRDTRRTDCGGVSMDAKTFLEEARRLCKAQHDCEDCPAYDGEICHLCYVPTGANNLVQMIETVKKWNEEHPKKTRLMDFLEKYPNAPLSGNGIPNLAPWNVGYCGDTTCYACGKAKGKPFAWCWGQEVEDDG